MRYIQANGHASENFETSQQLIDCWNSDTALGIPDLPAMIDMLTNRLIDIIEKQNTIIQRLGDKLGTTREVIHLLAEARTLPISDINEGHI